MTAQELHFDDVVNHALAAVVQNGEVVNLIRVADKEFDPGEGLRLVLLRADQFVTLGMLWDGEDFSHAPLDVSHDTEVAEETR